MNIYLIGFMASGKSTVGKPLAHQLSYSFVDLDALIEEKANTSIPQIFQTKGETYFRELEQSCLQDTLYAPNTVIATGGGTPCFFDNMDWMNANGHTVYLYMSPEGIYKRLKNDKAERPLVKDFCDEKLYAFINQSLAYRNSFYLKSRTVFEVSNGEISSLVEVLKLSNNP